MKDSGRSFWSTDGAEAVNEMTVLKMASAMKILDILMILLMRFDGIFRILKYNYKLNAFDYKLMDFLHL